ncbi:MAG: COX15/CtaA family protein [Bacteroidetes bacterium]|nr:COX15/CtaA family protein [Bacteroidota bacterium]
MVWVGGMVRSTGSGMGCPDWPRCFGNWVPPTSAAQLPIDYKEHYAALREKKNIRFAGFLRTVGLNETADKILEDKHILAEEDFNPAKTWVEYVNRLVGVATGILIIGLCIQSWRLRQADKRFFTGSALTLLVVVIQGWFGSIVVSTNLTPWTVTVHMLMALVDVALLAWLVDISNKGETVNGEGSKHWLYAAMAVMLVQIFLGTQVRESIDKLAAAYERSQWIARTGISFIIHRSFSWVAVVVQFVLWMKLRKTSLKKLLVHGPFLLILASVLTGTIMAYGSVPPALQPIHLALAVIGFGTYLQIHFSFRREAAIAMRI